MNPPPLPYCFSLTARYLSQEAGTVFAIPTPQPANELWWEGRAAVTPLPLIDCSSADDLVEKSLHNMALFLRACAPGGILGHEGPLVERMFLTEDYFGLWKRYLEEKGCFDLPELVYRLKDDDDFATLVEDPKKTFILDFLMTKEHEAHGASDVSRLYVPDMERLLGFLRFGVPMYGFNNFVDIEAAEEAWDAR